MRRFIVILRTLIVALLFTVYARSNVAADLSERYVAVVARIISAENSSHAAVRIRRAGKFIVEVSENTGLVKGDEIFLPDEKTLLIVTMLGSTESVSVLKSMQAPSTGVADWVVPDPRLDGVPQSALSLLVDWLLRPESTLSENAAGARGFGSACPSTSILPVIPLLAVPQVYLLSGKRALAVAWQGGEAPFDVRLSAAENGTLIAQARVENDCTARLPPVVLQPGRYRLSVTDAHGVANKQDHVLVVEAGPALPPELSRSALSEESLQLYSASWLLQKGDGSWAFEALQKVASMDCSNPSVSGWLRQRNASGLCRSPQSRSRIE